MMKCDEGKYQSTQHSMQIGYVVYCVNTLYDMAGSVNQVW